MHQVNLVIELIQLLRIFTIHRLIVKWVIIYMHIYIFFSNGTKKCEWSASVVWIKRKFSLVALKYQITRCKTFKMHIWCAWLCLNTIWYLIFLNELLLVVDCVFKLLPHGYNNKAAFSPATCSITPLNIIK